MSTTAITATVVGCAIQVTLVAGLAVLLHAMISKHRPDVRAAVAGAAVLAIMLITALAVCPLPAWWSLLPDAPTAADVRLAAITPEKTKQKTQVSPLAGQRRAPNAPRVDAAPPNTPLFALLDFSRFGAPNKVGRRPLWSSILLGVLAAGVCLASVRLGLNLRSVRRLRVDSSIVADEGVASSINNLKDGLSVSRRIQVREHPALFTAATIGCRRPIILLPAHWREWSDAELLAVLAHEVAHVARWDYLVRLAARVNVAMHCYHPFVHWLARRLVAEQELAADTLAAPLAGGRIQYLRALSLLALRQDCPSGACPAAFDLPVSSCFLMRRIEMLRAKDGSTGREIGSKVQWTAIATLALVATAATAIRGEAQKPAEKPAVRVANKSAAEKTADPLNAKPRDVEEYAPFRREPVDLSAVLSGDKGVAMFRPAAIFARPSMRKWAEVINKDFFESIALFGEPQDFCLRLEDIDFVAADLVTVYRRNENAEMKGTLQFGASMVVCRTVGPFDWKEALQKLAPDAVETEHNGHTYLQLPLIPAFGPAPICVCFPDDHTIVGLMVKDQIERLLDANYDLKPSPDLAEHWNGLNRGVFSLVLNNTEGQLAESFDLESPVAVAASPLLDGTKFVSLAIDWSDMSDRISVETRAECGALLSDRIVQSFQSLFGLVRTMLETGEPGDGQSQEVVGLLKSLLQDVTFKTEPASEGTSLVVGRAEATIRSDTLSLLLGEGDAEVTR